MRGKLDRIYHRQDGFTIIEILVVIVIIGILLALVFATYAGVARNERNQERRSDIQALYQQMEAYYVKNLEYPTLADMNNPAWLSKNMKTLNRESLRDPSSTSYTLVATPQPDRYAYAVRAADGGACDNKTVICAHYVLTATLEHSTPGIYFKDSLN
jgi:prepilin-type N-terminal cleavage/methylation domain-containing protein